MEPATCFPGLVGRLGWVKGSHVAGPRHPGASCGVKYRSQVMPPDARSPGHATEPGLTPGLGSELEGPGVAPWSLAHSGAPQGEGGRAERAEPPVAAGDGAAGVTQPAARKGDAGDEGGGDPEGRAGPDLSLSCEGGCSQRRSLERAGEEGVLEGGWEAFSSLDGRHQSSEHLRRASPAWFMAGARPRPEGLGLDSGRAHPWLADFLPRLGLRLMRLPHISVSLSLASCPFPPPLHAL